MAEPKTRWEKKTPEEMDIAGNLAEEKFNKMLPELDKPTLQKIAKWIDEEYLSAGYKRLSRVLKSYAGK